MLDTLIQNGFVIDGSGAPGYRAHVGIKDGRIAGIYVGNAPGAASVIDAAGLVVTPGFIDIHTHSDRTGSHHRGGRQLWRFCGAP